MTSRCRSSIRVESRLHGPSSGIIVRSNASKAKQSQVVEKSAPFLLPDRGLASKDKRSASVFEKSKKRVHQCSLGKSIEMAFIESR